MSTERAYPYQAWRLLPGYKPVEVTITGPAHFEGWLRMKDKGTIHPDDLFASKQEAFEVGTERLNAQQVKIDKMKGQLDKRRRTLRKEMGYAA